MKQLQKEMKLKGITNVQLAKRIGVSAMAVHNWLSGRYSPTAPNVKKMKQLGFSDSACLDPSKDIEV